MDFSPENLRKHFHALSAKTSAIHAELDPLRDELADLVAGNTKLSVKAAQAREAEIRAKIKAGQAKLFPIEQERATVARAIGPNTGPLQDSAAHLRDAHLEA